MFQSVFNPLKREEASEISPQGNCLKCRSSKIAIFGLQRQCGGDGSWNIFSCDQNEFSNDFIRATSSSAILNCFVEDGEEADALFCVAVGVGHHVGPDTGDDGGGDRAVDTDPRGTGGDDS